MTKSCKDLYFDDAINNLGEAFEYAVDACKLDIDKFMHMFIATGYAKQFEECNPMVVSGLSGTELAMEIIRKSGLKIEFPEPITRYDYSDTYWCGYIIAYYNWETNRSFNEINDCISMSKVLSLYHILHEAPEDKFVDMLNKKIDEMNKPSKLQNMRKNSGLTQKELSERTGINLRTLQQYETNAKPLENAAVNQVVKLADALGCEVLDLINR